MIPSPLSLSELPDLVRVGDARSYPQPRIQHEMHLLPGWAVRG
jgi:hypothetical protein